MGTDDYGHYKTTMAFYLAPNTLSNRGRFCCAYCELVFTDQWSLERVNFGRFFLSVIGKKKKKVIRFSI